MCTATWQDTDNGYILGFNRDEQRTRPQALYPKLSQIGTINTLFATDPVANGTWLAINDFGATVCLLNNYQAQLSSSKTQSFQSRGLLVKQFSKIKTQHQFQQLLAVIDLENYRGFKLLFKPAALQEQILVYDYNGDNAEYITSKQQCFTSSSYASARIIPHRLQLHRQLLATQTYTIEFMRNFHFKTDNTEPARGVCMQRSDAKTISYTEVELDLQKQLIYLRYTDTGSVADLQQHYLKICSF